MPQEVISPLSSLHGMYLEESASFFAGVRIYPLEDNVAGEWVAGLECSHIEIIVNIRDEGYVRKSWGFGNGGVKMSRRHLCKLINMYEVIARRSSPTSASTLPCLGWFRYEWTWSFSDKHYDSNDCTIDDELYRERWQVKLPNFPNRHRMSPRGA